MPAYSGPVYRPAYYPVAYGGYPYYYGLSGLSSGLQQPAVLPGAGLPGSGVALPGSSVQFTGTGAGAFDVNGLTGFFGTVSIFLYLFLSNSSHKVGLLE